MKICLVGYDINGLLGKNSGGAERQIALLARTFSKRGHEVTFVCVGYDGPEGMIEGVNVRSGWVSKSGIHGLRYLTYQLPRLRQVLKQISADVYYTICPSFYTKTVMEIAKRIGSIALLGIASDLELYRKTGKKVFITGNSFIELKIIPPIAYQLIYISALNTASCVISQNLWQEKRCKELKIKSHLILNPVEIPSMNLDTLSEKWDVIWVGNIQDKRREIKGFNSLASLIQKLPSITFCIVGNIYPMLSKIMNEISKLSNVYLMGPLPHNETMKVIAQSKLVINTSLAEGFSNVILEGWSLGKPAISLHVNSNNLLKDGGLGLCAQGDLQKMAEMIINYIGNDEERQFVGIRSRQYIQTYHNADVVCQQYETLF